MKLRKEKPEYVLSSVSRICSELLSARILTDAGKSPQEVADKMGMHIYPATLRINAASKKGLAALERAVTLCSETDVKIKTSRLEPYTAIEMLILSLGGRRNI